jgi:hypothetical protein
MRCVSIAKLSRDGKDVKPLPMQESAHGYYCMTCILPSPRHMYYTMIVRAALIAWGKTCTLTFVDNPAEGLRSSWPRPLAKGVKLELHPGAGGRCILYAFGSPDGLHK